MLRQWIENTRWDERISPSLETIAAQIDLQEYSRQSRDKGILWAAALKQRVAQTERLKRLERWDSWAEWPGQRIDNIASFRVTVLYRRAVERITLHMEWPLNNRLQVGGQVDTVLEQAIAEQMDMRGCHAWESCSRPGHQRVLLWWREGWRTQLRKQ